MNRVLRSLAAVAVALVACGEPQAEGPTRRDLIFVRTPGGIDALAAPSGASTLSVPGGVFAPDFSVLASVEPRGDATIVRRLGLLGAELTRTSLAGELEARVVSATGRLVALAGPRGRGASPYLPVGRKKTRLVVLEPSGTHREFVLKGNFEPEAFSVDDRVLFMIEYIPALAPDSYRVRRLLLDNGRVVPIGRLKDSAPGQMQGTGRTQVYSPDGRELYTLYTQQAEPGHHSAGSTRGHAFIHLLNLEQSWAHCIDLPLVFGSGKATASAIAVAPGSGDLYVVDWSQGVVAVVRPRFRRVVRTAQLDLGAPDDDTFAQASNKRLFVAGNSELLSLDAESLELRNRWSLDGEVTGLRLSPDSKMLYASTSNKIVALDVANGSIVQTFDAPGASRIEHIISRD